ncbi:DUF3467 domain-containing protein [Candidatus Woesearchaeota archaeon]|nr:DUF3467 domain-containing protein [Candidatus Woesearchaeota archaeon]
MTQEKKINLGISDGAAFFAHEMSIHFNPTQLIFDFKCITPRIDARSKESPFLNIQHNVVMLDPYHAKRAHELLGKVLGDYEKEFGRIDKPKQIKRLEKKKKKKGKEGNRQVDIPNYLG